jgi:phage-related protein
VGEEALIRLEICLMADPVQGKVVPGTSGLRKVRYTPPGSTSGKSGAHRVFYVHFPDYGLMVLWGIIAKREEKNLSKAETNLIAKRIRRLHQLLEGGVVR